MRTACGINGALRAHPRKKVAERLLLTIRRLHVSPIHFFLSFAILLVLPSFLFLSAPG